MPPREPRSVADPRRGLHGAGRGRSGRAKAASYEGMTCQELIDRLADYISHDVDLAGRRAIEAHLMICDRCVRYLHDYEVTVRLARSTAARAAKPRLR